MATLLSLPLTSGVRIGNLVCKCLTATRAFPAVILSLALPTRNDSLVKMVEGRSGIGDRVPSANRRAAAMMMMLDIRVDV